MVKCILILHLQFIILHKILAKTFICRFLNAKKRFFKFKQVLYYLRHLLLKGKSSSVQSSRYRTKDVAADLKSKIYQINRGLIAGNARNQKQRKSKR